MSSFNIVVDPPAAKELKKLKRISSNLLSCIIDDIESIGTDPYIGKPLKADKKGCYSLREGDYRIIYEVYKRQRIVHIIKVAHRRDVYR